MKRIEEKVRRKVKYFRILYQQSSGRDRLLLGLYGLMVLVYAWCVMVWL